MFPPTRRTFLWIFVWATSYGLLMHFFDVSQTKWQGQLLDSGLGLIWWLVELLYFVANTALLLVSIYFSREPFGMTLPRSYPFWYLASDAAMLVFLVHLTWLCAEGPVRHGLETSALWELSFS